MERKRRKNLKGREGKGRKDGHIAKLLPPYEEWEKSDEFYMYDSVKVECPFWWGSGRGRGGGSGRGRGRGARLVGEVSVVYKS